LVVPLIIGLIARIDLCEEIGEYTVKASGSSMLTAWPGCWLRP
jgi:hypothetical protein